MSKPVIRIYPDLESLATSAADAITSALEETLRHQETAAFVLTGGSTPEPVYETLSRPPFSSRLPWSRIHVLWGDERCVPPEHPDSNFGMAWKALLSRTEIPVENVHRMRGEMTEPEQAAALYEKEVTALLPSEITPSFDLVLLGMGADGHIASLFPGTAWDREKLVTATQMPTSGSWRISMTPRLLNEAAKIIFLVSGSRKAAALAQVVERSDDSVPAAWIRPSKGPLIWMIDSEAASHLRQI